MEANFGLLICSIFLVGFGNSFIGLFEGVLVRFIIFWVENDMSFVFLENGGILKDLEVMKYELGVIWVMVLICLSLRLARGICVLVLEKILLFEKFLLIYRKGCSSRVYFIEYNLLVVLLKVVLVINFLLFNEVGKGLIV